MFINFGNLRFFTSLARWVLQFFRLPFGSYYLLSLPFVTRQLILDRENRKLFSLSIDSYVDWATIVEIYVREEYSTRFSIYERKIRGFYDTLIQSGETPLILDLGGNIGVASHYFKNLYPKSMVVCIEPERKNALKAQVNLQNQTGIEVVEAAIASFDGYLQITDPGIGNNAFRTSADGLGAFARVKATSVDTLLSDFGHCTPFIVKIDIEGAESELFSSNCSWISRFELLIAETHDWLIPGKGLSSHLLREIGTQKRDFFFRGENIFSVRNDPLM